MGSSYGAAVVLHTVKHLDTGVKALFIVATPPWLIPLEKELTINLPIIAFHGREDEIADLGEAETILQRRFQHRLTFFSFEHEGHFFHWITSYAKIVAEILRKAAE